MKYCLIILLAILMPAYSYAWNYGGELTITSVTMWENSEVNPLYFKRSDDVWCYVPASEKLLHSLILTLYASGKTAEIHCYDLEESPLTFYPAHKLHRIIAK